MALGVTSCVHALTGSGTSATSATLDTTGAKCLVFYIKFDNANPTSLSWSDNKGNNAGNVVQIQTTKDFAAQRNMVFYWPVTNVGAGHTITATWTNNASSEIMFGGITASGAVTIDQSADWLFDSGAPYLCSSITPTV